MCMVCTGIGHNQFRECKDRPEQCIIYTRTHKIENYRYEIIRCIVKKGKIYIYVMPKCANCDGIYQATAFKYTIKQKVQAIVWKNKAQKA